MSIKNHYVQLPWSLKLSLIQVDQEKEKQKLKVSRYYLLVWSFSEWNRVLVKVAVDLSGPDQDTIEEYFV